MLASMRKHATEGLGQQRKMTKQKKKKEAAKKGKVVEVTAEMVAESNKHAAELLEMFGSSGVMSGGSGSTKSKTKKTGQGKKSKKKKGKRRK